MTVAFLEITDAFSVNMSEFLKINHCLQFNRKNMLSKVCPHGRTKLIIKTVQRKTNKKPTHVITVLMSFFS